MGLVAGFDGRRAGLVVGSRLEVGRYGDRCNVLRSRPT
jgi:hypothetical protein